MIRIKYKFLGKNHNLYRINCRNLPHIKEEGWCCMRVPPYDVEKLSI